MWKALQEFDAQALEAGALWGKSIKSKSDALRACVHELRISIDAVIDDKVAGGANFTADKEFAKVVRADVHASSSNKDNKLSKKIDAAVGGIEAERKPHLVRS